MSNQMSENCKRALYAVNATLANYNATAVAKQQGKATDEELAEAYDRYASAYNDFVQGGCAGNRGGRRKRATKKARARRTKTRRT